MGSQVIRMAAQMTQNNGVTSNISVKDRLMINKKMMPGGQRQGMILQ
jgi:hypothetical protein